MVQCKIDRNVSNQSKTFFGLGMPYQCCQSLVFLVLSVSMHSIVIDKVNATSSHSESFEIALGIGNKANIIDAVDTWFLMSEVV